MIDPAGNARYPGRIIGQVYEKSITFEIAQQLSSLLNSKSITVVITRSAGEIITQEQKAHLANRLQPDLYVALQCSWNPSRKQHVNVYRFSRNEPFSQPFDIDQCIPYEKAHFVSAKQSTRYGERLVTSLQTKNGFSPFQQSLYSLPCSSLLGITSPALCIEISCHDDQSWHSMVPSLAHALQETVRS